MTSKIVYLGNLRTEATHLRSGNKIITDAPVDNQGKGEAFSPTDLAATSLGSCIMTIMGIAAQRHEIDMTGTTAEVTKHMASNPRRIEKIEVNITMPNLAYTEKEKKILNRAAHYCPVALSLSEETEESINIKWPQ
jgi:uncharacterized OsmC-like protein